MDVNGTRYHLLAGPRDWAPRLAAEASSLEPLRWDPRRQAVLLPQELPTFGARASERPLTLADRRGAAADRFGRTFFVSGDRREIHLHQVGLPTARFWSVAELAALPVRGDAAAGEFVACPPPGPAPAPRLACLAVTDRGYLVAGTVEPSGLLVFDLPGGGPPTWLRWPEVAGARPFSPFDLAAVCGGGLWVLDRPLPDMIPAAGPVRLWRLDRDLRLVSPEEPAPLALPAGTLALTALPDGSVLLLTRDDASGRATLRRWRLDGPLGTVADLGDVLAARFGAESFGAGRFTAHDVAFLADAAPAPGLVSGTVYLATSAGNQSFAFRLSTGLFGTPEAETLELEALDAYLPMRRFSGKGLVEGANEVAYDFDELWLPLAELPRPRYARRGRLAGLVFDGKEPGCVWHRLFLDACIPPGDEIVVESRAADSAAELAQMPWQVEPALHLRASGPERAFAPAPAPSHPGEGTWELLFQAARGRFVELALTLRASGRSSPKIASLRVHYPRFSYLGHYLPAVFREEPVSASFLDRFLANFEGTFTELEDRVAAAERWFDVRTSPPEALDWLAGWMGAVLDPDWDEARRRLFLSHVAELYNRRGTPRGLTQAIRLAVDPCPSERLFDEDDGTDPFPVRVAEGFRNRLLPAMPADDPTLLENADSGPLFLPAGTPWQPRHGGALLAERYREYLRARYGASDAGLDHLAASWGMRYPSWNAIGLSALPPAPPAQAADQRRFLTGAVRGYAEISAADLPAWQAFLTGRYRRIAALNRAWEKSPEDAFEDFDEVPLPAAWPADGAPLADWTHFATVALPIERSAHRFTVLVPVTPETPPAEREKRLARVAAVVEREKPAHTRFDVQLYWALFRVGAARIGLDTVIGEGSRVTALVLGSQNGSGYLGAGLLAGRDTPPPTDRLVAGETPLGSRPLS